MFIMFCANQLLSITSGIGQQRTETYGRGEKFVWAHGNTNTDPEIIFKIIITNRVEKSQGYRGKCTLHVLTSGMFLHYHPFQARLCLVESSYEKILGQNISDFSNFCH